MRKKTTSELVQRQLKNTKEPRFPVSVLLNNVRSLENVGLIFRLCDALRMEKLYLTGITGFPHFGNDPRPFHIFERADRWIRKTAIQTVDFVPWEFRKDPLKLLQSLKLLKYRIVALEQTDKSLPYYQAKPSFPLVLILGHEREGIDAKILKIADEVWEIPMHGKGNNLNVAMSLAVVGYHLIYKSYTS